MLTIEREWKGQGKNPDPMRFILTRVEIAIKQVAVAAGGGDSILLFDGTDKMDWSDMALLTTRLRSMLDKVYKDQGHVTVRFLGDLKPTTYPLDTQFFHLSNPVTENEF